MFISYISKGNGLIYTDTNSIFKSSIAAIDFLNILRPFRLAKAVIYHKEYWLTCERFCVFWSAACWGGNRGVRGTAIPYEKLGNTEIRRNTDTAFMIGRVLYVFATSSMYAPENNVRHYEKTWEDLGQFNDWKAQSIPLSLKSLTFIKLFSLLWFLLHIVLTRSVRQESENALNGTAGNTVKDLLLPNTVNKKDETPHTAAGLDDTAIPHIKIQITEIPLEKQLTAIPQYLKPPCPPLCCLASSELICIITIRI